MIATQKEKVVRVFDFVREDETYRFKGTLASEKWKHHVQRQINFKKCIGIK